MPESNEAAMLKELGLDEAYEFNQVGKTREKAVDIGKSLVSAVKKTQNGFLMVTTRRGKLMRETGMETFFGNAYYEKIGSFVEENGRVHIEGEGVMEYTALSVVRNSSKDTRTILVGSQVVGGNGEIEYTSVEQLDGGIIFRDWYNKKVNSDQ